MKTRDFSYKSAHYRLGEGSFVQASISIQRLRDELETYILTNPSFLDSLVPVEPRGSVPEIARRMHEASLLTGLGPMASVAGTIAQMACEECQKKGDSDILVENGGDLYLDLKENVTLGIYAGERIFKGKLAFSLQKADMPLAVCSSSSTMGHSLSLGHCDLATVFSREGALADSAATLAANLVNSEDDLEPTVNRILAIPGIRGIFLVKGEKIGLGGQLPELISLSDPDIRAKITRDRSEKSSFI